MFDNIFISWIYGFSYFMKFIFHLFLTGLSTAFQQKNIQNVNKYKISKQTCGIYKCFK